MRQKRRNRFMSRSSTVEEAGNKKNGGLHEQMKESIEIHSLEELKKLIMEKDDNEILTVTVEVAADES